MPHIRELVTIDGDGTNHLPAYTWPGGYPILYYDRDGFFLCALCAEKLWKDEDATSDDKPTGADVYYEGPTWFCTQCNKEIESAYGDPDEQEEE